MPAHDKSSEQARTIEAEHVELRAMLRDIQATDLADLMPKLGQLRQLLVDHFQTEEGPEGLEAITQRQPQYLARLGEIFEEHRAFLARLDDISAQTQACLHQRKEVLGAVHALAHDLHEHEAKENELVGDVFYTDLGGGS